jgi:hypothetical protein
MRGDFLARQWRIIRANGASPNGLTMTEIATHDGAQVGPTEEKPFKSLFQKLEWAFLLWGAKANRLF